MTTVRTHTIKTIKEITKNCENEGPITQINAKAAQSLKDIVEHKLIKKSKSTGTKLKEDINETIKNKEKKSKKIGEAIGYIMAFPFHVLFGRGGTTFKNGYSRSSLDRFLDRGILGYTVYYAASSIGTTAQMIGYGAGFLGATMAIPLKAYKKGQILKNLDDEAKRIGHLTGDFVGHMIATPSALAIKLARIPGVVITSLGKGLGFLIGKVDGSILKLKHPA